MATRKLKVGSVFSGAGGLDLGFVQNGFNVAFHVEREHNACETLRHNPKYFQNENVWECDIQKVELNEMKEFIGLDGLIGGPPCQAFSSARGAFDETNESVQEKIGLTYTYIQWVGYLQPRFFLFENTEGLAQGKKKAILHDVLQQLEKQGYRIKYKILNAHLYGSAQKRKRVFIVGVRNDQNWDFKFPNQVPKEERKYVRDILDPPGAPFVGKKLRDKFKRIMPFVPPGGYWRDLPDHLIKEVIPPKQYELLQRGESLSGGMTGVCRRIHPDKECPTITTDPSQNQTLIVVPHENRVVSVSECKRAQGFPEDYEIIGSVDEQYTYIGNAVAGEMATALAKQIAACMSEDSKTMEEEVEIMAALPLAAVAIEEEPMCFEQLSLF